MLLRSATEASVHKTLRVGSRGADVLAVQRELKRRIAPKLELTGYFGSHTERAVRRFQEAVGFRGHDIDGIVGPKTMVALFQTFDMTIKGRLIPNLKAPAISPVTKPSPVAKPLLPKPVASVPIKPVQNNAVNTLPKRFQGNIQFGPQGSLRDGEGLQVQASLTFRTRDFFPHSDTKHVYDGAHLELIPALNFGIPVARGSIFTGQLSVTVQPLTDWLVIGERWHLLTPQIGAFGQIPLDPGDSAEGSLDPATHARLGGFLGAELVHFDILPDRLVIGVSAQESFYMDFSDKRIYWDPSVMGFLQLTIGSWSQYKPLSN
jgi:hypothetical protein